MTEAPVDELPIGWEWACNDKLGEFINGAAFKPTDWSEEGVPIVRIQNLTNPEKPFNRTLREVDERFHLKNGDILVSWSATLDVFVWEGGEAYVNQHIFKVVPSEHLENRFIRYALKLSIQELLNSEHLHGTTMKHVNRKPFLAHPVPIPPLNEQKRIADKIDTLFTQLDKGERIVREVQKLLTRYRQSVLKSAVTGKLTADWRKEHGDDLKDGEAHLLQILDARRSGWSAKSKYKPPVEPDLGEFEIDIPSEWVWTSVDQILRAGLSNGRSVPDAEDEGFPVMRLTALKDGLIDILERKQGAWTAADAEPFLVEKGDILVSRGNGSKQLVGRGGLIAGEVDPVAYPDTMIRVPIDLEHLSPEWFVQVWNSPFMRAQIEKAAKTTAGIYKINQGDIRSFVVPLPSLQEQRQIASVVADEIAKTTDLERWCETELKRSSSLRQSILKDAFAGRLVPQDPNDEPASAILARIAADKASTKKSSRKASDEQIRLL